MVFPQCIELHMPSITEMAKMKINKDFLIDTEFVDLATELRKEEGRGKGERSPTRP